MTAKTTFRWAWNNHAPQPDALMTRARAARLLRAWRRVSRQPSNGPRYYLARIHNPSGTAYSCTVPDFAETGTLYLDRTP